MHAMRNMVATETTGPSEPSVLAKYIERFRFGKPQSREERECGATDGYDQPFWWMSTSPPSSSTPTQTSERHAREIPGLNTDPSSLHSPISKSPVRDSLNLSMLTLSESSQCDPEEPEILQLQERAKHLLQKSEHSLSCGSVPISSEGLGCFDSSSPINANEPVQKPIVPILMGSTNCLDPGLCEGTLLQTLDDGSVRSAARREDDILFQWRLRRKMEQARLWCQEVPTHNSVLQVPLAHSVAPNQKTHHSHFSNTPLQRSHLTFTPITLASLDPPTSEPAFPISSPSVSRLQPDATFQPQQQPDLHSKPDPRPHYLTERVTKNTEATSAPCRRHRQIGTQVNIPETTKQHSTRQKSSSPSPRTSDSTEEHWPDPQGKKVRAENDRREKTAPSNRKKKSERVDRHSSPVRAGQARGHEGVSRKAREVSEKSRWQEEGQRSTQGGRSGERAPPPSPIHNALGQVVSEVLFHSVDSPTPCKTPSSSVSPAFTPPSPPQSPVAPPPVAPPPVVQQPFEVIDQLMQDAEDSDGKEFENDPLLQVLRRQRKWVKEQLCEVEMTLELCLPSTPPTVT